MGAFTPAIWSTIAWTEKFNNGLCTHFLQLRGLKSSIMGYVPIFLQLRGLKSSHNSSSLKNCRYELSLKTSSVMRVSQFPLPLPPRYRSMSGTRSVNGINKGKSL